MRLREYHIDLMVLDCVKSVELNVRINDYAVSHRMFLRNQN